MSSTPEKLLELARCCPFCGSHDLKIEDWVCPDGLFENHAIQCNRCGGFAPGETWNHRLEDPDEPGWPPRMQ